jgi:hypothetical protein
MHRPQSARHAAQVVRVGACCLVPAIAAAFTLVPAIGSRADIIYLSQTRTVTAHAAGSPDPMPQINLFQSKSAPDFGPFADTAEEQFSVDSNLNGHAYTVGGHAKFAILDSRLDPLSITAKTNYVVESGDSFIGEIQSTATFLLDVTFRLDQPHGFQFYTNPIGAGGNGASKETISFTRSDGTPVPRNPFIVIPGIGSPVFVGTLSPDVYKLRVFVTATNPSLSSVGPVDYAVSLALTPTAAAIPLPAAFPLALSGVPMALLLRRRLCGRRPAV